jgi:hypothetical protein
MFASNKSGIDGKANKSCTFCQGKRRIINSDYQEINSISDRSSS